jgi:hypothetical protein
VSLHSVPSPSFTDDHLSWAGLRARVSRLCPRPSVQHSSSHPQLRQEDFGQDANAHPTPNLIQPTPAFILNNIQQWSQPPAPTRPVRCDMEVRGSSDIRIHETTRLRTRTHTLHKVPHILQLVIGAQQGSVARGSASVRCPYSKVAAGPSAMHGTHTNGCLGRAGSHWLGTCMFSQPPFLGRPETHRYGAYDAYEGAPLSALFETDATRGHTPLRVGPGRTRFALSPDAQRAT